MKTAKLMVSLMLLSLLLTACGGVNAPMGVDGREMLKEAKQMSNTLVYVNQNIDHKKYTKLLLEPVVIYDKEDHDFGEIDQADRQMMADFVRDEFITAFKDSKFPLVNSSSPEAVKVKFTLVGLTRSVPVAQGVNYALFPYGTGIQLLKGALGKPGTFMGNAVLAAEFNDSLNDELVAALVTKLTASAINFKAAFDGKYGAAKSGITDFMQAVRKSADESHGFAPEK